MKKIILSGLILSLFASALWAQSKTYEFRNGNWFNGEGFTSGNWYVVAGALTQKAPAKIDSIIDLEGRWVIPPMGDAHSSSLAGNPSPEYAVKAYHNEGIFYTQTLSNTQEGRKAAKPYVNSAAGIDALFANGGITCTLGQPFLRYEGPAQNIRNLQVMAERYEQIKLNRKALGDGYWFIDNKDSLHTNWHKIVAQKPDLISIYLLDATENGGKEGKGLTAEMAKMVIKNAHKAHLRVYAFVETAEDVRLALKLGVDGLANLPGNIWDGKSDNSKFTLTDEDLKKLAKKKTPVVPLFSHGQGGTAQPALQAYQAKLLKRMIDNGVNVVIGSDDPQRTTRTELNYWFQLADLNYNQTLKIICENTPRAIYPDRKIGRIAEGFEASFVVLNDNPLQNLLKVRAISFLVKNGKVMRAN